MSVSFCNDRVNLTMLTDFYEITMANGYFVSGFKDTIGYFDMFFRKVPDGGGFAIMAGVEQLVDYLKNLSFSDEDIQYLRSKNIFREEFLEYLRNFKFVCDVWAVPEGTPIFPGEPIVTVRGPVIQAQFVETMVLLSINHQSLIATKTNRIVRAADGRAVMEFGSRRAQGFDGAIYGARAAYIGGCIGTACTISDRRFGVPALGTMAHSWVQLFDSEYEAFKAYATNIRTTARSLSTRTTCSSPAFRTRSAFLTKCLYRRATARRHPHRQRRHHLPFPQGAENAG